MSDIIQADIDRAVSAERSRCIGILAVSECAPRGWILADQCIRQGMDVPAADAWVRGADARMAAAGGAATGASGAPAGDSDEGVSASWDRAFGAHTKKD